MSRIIIIILSFCPFLSSATHLLGGMMDLQWQGGKSYKLTVRVILDCQSSSTASFDNNIEVGMFEKGTNTLVNSITMTFDKLQIDTLKIPEGCKNKYKICTRIGVYSNIILLDSNNFNHPNGYYFNWQRCCKGSLLLNVLKSEETGLNLYLEVQSFKSIINSSPVFQKYPSILVQSGKPISYNFGFLDPDNDSLIYRLAPPLKSSLDKNVPLSNVPIPGPYPNVVLANGYTLNNLIGGKEALRIDSNMGTLTGLTDKPGSYLVGVIVEEIRNGQKIGEVRLEIEINVVNDNKPAPEIILTSSDYTELIGNNIEVHTTDSFYFKVLARTPFDSIYIHILIADSLIGPFTIKPNYPILSGGKLVKEASFSWQTYCHMEDSGNLIPITIKAYDNDCLSPNITTRPLLLKITDVPRIYGPAEVCMGAQDIEFSLPKNLKGNAYQWTLPVKVNGLGSGHSILLDFDHSIFNANISVSGLNACGNNFSATHSVNTGFKQPTPTLTYSGNVIHSNILYGNQWFRDDTAIIGETKNYIELKKNGKYYSIINWLGCKSEPSKSIMIDIFSSNNEIQNLLPIVAPNPFSESIEILNSDWPFSTEVLLMNTFGQILLQEKLRNRARISTMDLPAGMYVLIMKSEDRIYKQKMLKY